jgi:hypothetical protein
LIRERLADGTSPVIPEDSGLLAAISYGPNAVIKLRKQTQITSEILPTFGKCIDILYQGRMQVTKALRTTEWAMVGSLGNDSLSEIIPAYHRLHVPPEASPYISARNQRIRDSGLRTQNHDKELDIFIRKFDPDVEMSQSRKDTTVTTVGQFT